MASVSIVVLSASSIEELKQKIVIAILAGMKRVIAYEVESHKDNITTYSCVLTTALGVEVTSSPLEVKIVEADTAERLTTLVNENLAGDYPVFGFYNFVVHYDNTFKYSAMLFNQ